MPALIPSARLARRAARWITDAFGVLFYSDESSFTLNWMGASMLKCPTDLFVYQEILFETRPDVIVETGTFHGGSAFYLAHLCELLQHGRVVTIDLVEQPGRPRHPRLQYLSGYSTDERTEALLRECLRPGEKVMVILDSDHRREHVLRELQIYAKYVSEGCYLIVEDTNINGHPALPSYGPGPMEAVREFMQGNREFRVDRARERFRLTFNPEGYLQRNPKEDKNAPAAAGNRGVLNSNPY